MHTHANRNRTIAAVFTAVAMLALGAQATQIEADGNAQVVMQDGRTVLIYNTNGTFTVTEPGTIELLAVGGGGGGGGNNTSSSEPNRGGGGGGGGGVYTNSSFGVSAGTYTVVIGAGGGAGQDGVARAPNGGKTTLSLGSGSALVTAYGGGGGGQSNGYSGSNGASGGGSSRQWVDTAYMDPGNAIYRDAPYYNLGHSGGKGGHPYGPGGGGGAGEAGGEGNGSAPGKGGDGVEIPILASGMYYGGGGAGYRANYTVAGGKGGGGKVGQPGENGKGGGGSGGQRGGSGTLVLAFTPSATVDSGFFEGEGGNEVIEIRDDSVRDEVRVFRQSGTLTLTGRGTVEVLAVGGGGGGGAVNGGQWGCGGGGAGGVVHYTNLAVSAGTYSITIGAGGAIGANGGVTRGLGVVAYGGGAGAANGGKTGAAGASGGGASHSFSDINTTTNVGGRAIYSVYMNMGSAGGQSTHPYYPGGGGGATSPGGVGEARNGGAGYQCSITGTATAYGGGGAGCALNSGNASVIEGSAGGGGKVVGTTGYPGTPNTGGGGAGGAAGGSGVFIVRYHLKPLATVIYMR